MEFMKDGQHEELDKELVLQAGLPAPENTLSKYHREQLLRSILHGLKPQIIRSSLKDTRRHLFATKNASWRFRTRSWTPHGIPPKEARCDEQKNANKGTMVAWGHGANRMELGLWSTLIERTAPEET
jgi:hypothetical protein